MARVTVCDGDGDDAAVRQQDRHRHLADTVTAC